MSLSPVMTEEVSSLTASRLRMVVLGEEVDIFLFGDDAEMG